MKQLGPCPDGQGGRGAGQNKEGGDASDAKEGGKEVLVWNIEKESSEAEVEATDEGR